MATYVEKKTRMFMERPEWVRPLRRRSESRLKTYPSSTDIRNWCDVVEDRRQHILELILKELDSCTGKLIPVSVLLDMLLAMANADLKQLQNSYDQLLAFVNGLDLSEEDKRKLKELQGMKTGSGQLRSGAIGQEDLNEVLTGQTSMQGPGKMSGAIGQEECDPECEASTTHPKFAKKHDDVPTIQTSMQGPGKMITRIKGLQPGFEVIDDPSSPAHLIIKPAKRPIGSPSESEDTSKGEVSLPTADKLAATEALCKEQQNTIVGLTKERDNLKTKLDACIKELDNFKKLQTVANPSLPISCQQEIEALEAEIKIMRSGNLSPEEEAEIIKKEVEMLKRYCTKLEKVENENEKLKVELGSRVAIKDSGYEIDAKKVETLKDKLKHLEQLTKDRDTLASKVHELEKKLSQYQDVPDDLELLRSRSDMLDNVMQERDTLSQKIKTMKGMEDEMYKLKTKADRVDQLERELKNMSKDDRSSGLALKKTQSIAGNLEIELQNVKCERDAMQKRIDNMKKDLDNQKAKATEAEMLRLERDRLQIKLNELTDIQAEYDDMMSKIKIFDNIKAERDLYKQKYEEVLDIECKCEMLKAQIDEARTVSRERDQLQKQVQDLEACICEQEDEIKSLVLHVDGLSKTRTDASNQLSSFKQEMSKKDQLLAVSQEQAAQSQNLALKIKELEKQLHNTEHMLLQKECHIKCLETELNSRTDSIGACRKLNKKDLDAVALMRKELEAAKAENRHLQAIGNKMLTLNSDDHVKKMLKQSECAVKRVVQELGKQYLEWDHIKSKSPKGKFGVSNKQGCLCHSAGTDVSSGDDCEKLRIELEELQREKHKLEFTVKQLQGQGVRSTSPTKCPCPCPKILK